MAVYERNYKSYAGRLTAPRTRFLVLPRYAYKEVFRSKLFVSFLASLFVWPFVLTLIIYIPHNLSFLESAGIDGAEMILEFSLFRFDAAWFFWRFVVPYYVVAALVALIVGPALISADLRNNGLPLYLARPFSRSEYLLGKSTVLIGMLSAVTLAPGMFLFLFQSYMGGWKWFIEHLRVGLAIVVSFGIWVLILCLVSLALSAYLKWKPVARVAFLGIFIVAGPLLAALINFMFRTSWGSVVNVVDMMAVASSWIFGIEGPGGVPVWAAWLSLLAFCGFFLLVLSRKVRAYEIVRS